MATPPDFVAGQVLTAAQMNKIGWWLIKTQTVGTAVASVSVTDAFSADYENYRILYTGGSGSTNAYVQIHLGSTTTGYYYAGLGLSFSGVAANTNGDNLGFVLAGYMTAATVNFDCTVYQPFASNETVFTAQFVNTRTGGSGNAQFVGGWLNNTTSYTGFTIAGNTGTLTGGTIYVYGLRD